MILWVVALGMALLGARWIRANAREETEFERRLDELERGDQ